MGSVVGSVVNTIAKPVMSTFTKGPLGDMLLGQKDPGVAAQTIDLASPEGRDLQSKLLKEYGKTIGQGADAEVSAMEAQARQNVADQERRAAQLVAQRGMGGTASGINAILNQKKGLNDQIAAIRAQAPGLARQNLNFATSGINQILGEQGSSKIYSAGTPSQGRTGGLAPLLGGAAGLYASGGNPQAGMAGMQAGQLLTKMF